MVKTTDKRTNKTTEGKSFEHLEHKIEDAESGSAGGASAYHFTSVDELPTDAVDGSLAVVESDSLKGKWEWKDNTSPLDLSMLNLPTDVMRTHIANIKGYDNLNGPFTLLSFELSEDGIFKISYNDALIYINGVFDDTYNQFEFYEDIQTVYVIKGTFTSAILYFTEDDFKTFIKTNCNRLSGGHSLYSRENGEWVYKEEI